MNLDIRQINPERIAFSFQRQLLYSDGETKIKYWMDDMNLYSEIRHKNHVYAIKNQIGFWNEVPAKSVATKTEYFWDSSTVMEWTHRDKTTELQYLDSRDMLAILQSQVTKLIDELKRQLKIESN